MRSGAGEPPGPPPPRRRESPGVAWEWPVLGFPDFHGFPEDLLGFKIGFLDSGWLSFDDFGWICFDLG